MEVLDEGFWYVGVLERGVTIIPDNWLVKGLKTVAMPTNASGEELQEMVAARAPLSSNFRLEPVETIFVRAGKFYSRTITATEGNLLW